MSWKFAEQGRHREPHRDVVEQVANRFGEPAFTELGRLHEESGDRRVHQQDRGCHFPPVTFHKPQRAPENFRKIRPPALAAIIKWEKVGA